MSKLKLYFLFILSSFTISSSIGQDVSFSQFYANPLYLNPAFAGTMGVPRIALQYRNQWHGFDNAFTTYTACLDLPVPKLRGGLGLYFMNDLQANGALNAYQVNAAYSVAVPLNEDFVMNLGVQGGFNQNSLRIDELIFADNLDMISGNHGVSGEVSNITDPEYTFFDFSTGILVYSERYFGGFSLSHLAEPYHSYTLAENSGSTLKQKFTAHFGARLPVYVHGHHRKKFDISPQFILQKQGIFQQVNYGLFAAKRGIAVGTWFRQNFGLRYDAVIFLVGFLRSRWQFTYSYDFTVSGLAGSSGGTSEVSLVFLLKESHNKNRLPFYEQYFEEFGEM